MRTSLQKITSVLTVAAAFAAAAPGLAQTTQKFPTKPVRVLIGFSPGSATDILARIIGPKLADMWGHPVVIENRSGASGMFATTMVAQATPDGHTLLLMTGTFAINAVLQKNLPYDALKGFRGVIHIGAGNSAIMVAPSLGVKSIKELIALANERPSKILFGSTGATGVVRMSTERFNMAAGINVTHVGFKGQPEMLIEVLAGRIHYSLLGLSAALSFVRDGRLLALAVVTPKRSPLLPDVPAMVEILPKFERDAGHGLLAPGRTPNAIVHQINKDVVRVIELPDVKERFQAIAFEPAPTTPEDYDQLIRSQIQIYTRVAKAVGLLSQ